MSDASSVISQQFKDGGVVPAGLVGQEAVSKTYVDSKLNEQDQKINNISSGLAGKADVNHRHNNATVNTDGFMSSSDKTKLNGISTGAEVNQNAIASINNISASNKSDAVTFEGGTGITVSTNPTSKKVIITSTGTSTPGIHGSAHNSDGSDPIPDLVYVKVKIEDLIKPPRARYSSNVDKVCPTLTWTSPDWNLKVYDTEHFIDQLDPTKINISKSGTYLIQAQTTFEANDVGQRNIRIVKNDSQIIGYSSNRAAINATRINVATTAYLNVGEYLRVSCYHDVYPDSLRFDTSGGMALSITRLCPPERGASYESRLYAPTHITKLNSKYFIVDCYHHRVIWSDSLTKPISEWVTVDVELAGGHSIASDGNIYVIENAGYNEVLVLDSNLRLKQRIANVTHRPHRTIYDPATDAFYVIATPNVYCYKNVGGQLVLHHQKEIPFIVNSYVRSIKIIDGYMYIISGNGYINVVNYADQSYSIVNSYPVPAFMGVMNDIARIGDYYYMTATQNSNHEVAPSVVRIRDLSRLQYSEHEDLYTTLGFTATPYYIENFDGEIFITEIGDENRIMSFKGSDLSYTDHYVFGNPTADDANRRDVYPL